LLTHIKVVKKRLVKLVSFAAALLSFALLPIAHAAISEGDALNYFQQGNDQYRLGNIAAAVADYTVAIQFEPGVALLYSARGGARHALGDYQSALTDFTIAIQLSPRWASLDEGRAAVHISLKNYDAVKDFRKCWPRTRETTMSMFGRSLS
jgi:tetratricopeptide (TPR) repeat protein